MNYEKELQQLFSDAFDKAINSGQRVLFTRDNALWEITLSGEKKLRDIEPMVKVKNKRIILKRK